MNKKIIKTIASITCGLGIVTSIPFMSSSCKNKTSDEIKDKFVQTSEEDWNIETRWAPIYFNSISDVGKSKFNSWKKEGYNGLILPRTKCN